ncbi:hypothetical protein D9757_007388 [Collybiopsis confluens]|uniref:Uncharacterized protein n=1 Tax=Collybiopsis confluens TaxID=2823264 RepID=A0A8H5M7T8_9AGAR|nr:hypothetical protein D9757_007388 [Collybiopsis confluens]
MTRFHSSSHDMVLPGTVTVFALIPGHFYLPQKDVFQDALETGAGGGDIVPTFAFLVEHHSRGKYMFDLGLRKRAEGYPPAWTETLEELKPDCDEDVCDILHANHILPSEIKGVIFRSVSVSSESRDIEPFTSAEIILGAEAKPLFNKPYPDDPESLFLAWPSDRTVRYLEFSHGAESLLPAFEKAFDFFGDQSLYIVDAPGHFPGHLMALARVYSPNPTSAHSNTSSESVYVLLAGDCCHNRQCYNPGTRTISEENYEDIAVARNTVSALVRTANEMPNVVVVLAHEKELEVEGMPLLPNSLNEWAVGRCADRLANQSYTSL